ncbi:hypothetical protein [Megalodesulfovibrio gigas]|uniref:Uncharacterized protein n=1 Tax=Megalodesulfovibrio gigas (strain ATCC 19364 / DSM 1382 / NCIMB 9332 / VKM B-1759) TaxID=1121448 RepID=T2GEX6_MEGG1|nr:hypothetical protein [Megalodesulfovibrio gigas]AGW15125.1 hypothetical protein DGI_3445 [Megalodesulfovibrio gigas DSM 1382 = ATCC 19364]
MGRHLQVIVSAYTYRPEDIEKVWPRLHHLAWGTVPTAGPQPKKGVLELVEALDDALNFGNHPKDVKAALERKLAVAKSRKRSLENALADWKPGEANALSDQLEDVLAELEALAPPVVD